MKYRIFLILILSCVLFAATAVFQEEKSVFFVMDEVGAIFQVGGCTQAWWDAEVASSDAETAMGKLMDVDTGAPIINMTLVTYDQATNKLQKANIHDGVEVGMVVYVEKDGGIGDVVYTNYKITAVDTDEITCAGINGTDCTVIARVGGAFDTLQNALDGTDGTDHSVTIYVQSTPVLSVSIDADSGGHNVRNVFKRFVGFNTAPGDMSYGGAYYQSPFEMLLNGSIDATKTVLLDADDGAFELININTDNIIIENFHLSNNDENEAAIIFTATPKNIVFRNCRFSAVKFVEKTEADNVLFDSCFAVDMTWIHYQFYGNNNVLLNCISSGVAGGSYFASVKAYVSGSQIIGCIVIGGARGVNFDSDSEYAFIVNNVFVDQTVAAIHLTTAGVIAYNNIFFLTPDAAAFYLGVSGSVFYNDYNCFIESDGTPLTVGIHSAGYEVPIIGSHSIELDPLFVDAAGGDFRLKNGSPCLNVGKKDGSNGLSSIGVWQPRFGRNKRIMYRRN